VRVREADDLKSIVAAMENSIPWMVVQRLRAVRDYLLPRGTYRRFLTDRSLRVLRIAMSEGVSGLRSAWSRRRSRSRSTTEKYARWIAENEPSPMALKDQVELAEQLRYHPLVSIVMPTWNPKKQILLEAVRSVIEQTYANWQLCIAGGGDDPEVAGMLLQIERMDRRISVRALQANLGISGNSNEALALARGEFIALLDHDDVIAPFALYEVVRLVNERRNLDFIYSDRDMISENGKTRYAPLFKPEWSPEIMLSANYLTHLCVIRTRLIQEVGGFRSETDEAQDWDLFLRVIEKTSCVAHIPKVLYHWRSSPNSAASGIQAKPRAMERQVKVVTEHLHAKGLNPFVSFTRNGILRVTWPLSERHRVSIIVPSGDRTGRLRACIRSILARTLYEHYEVLIVENGGSNTATRDFYAEAAPDARVRILEFRQASNDSAINNFGARHASGDVLLFLSNDTEVIDPDWLEEMLRWIERPEIGAVGSKLLAKNGTIQHAGIVLGLTGFAGHIYAGAREMHWDCFGSTEWYRNYLAVTGACLMIKTELFRLIGGFNEQFEPYRSDVELCLRIYRRGLRIVYTPFARLRKYEAPRRLLISQKNFAQSPAWYKSFLENCDPFFNPNISFRHLVPAFRGTEEPPRLSFAEDLAANFTAPNSD
jgi:GT2 family glycosyltransferase